MEPDSTPTELILTNPQQSLGKGQLGWRPQPGNYLEWKGQTYAVLESHNHYQYKVDGYRLEKISLYVQSATRPTEQSLVGGRWMIGDINCRYNARSELLRCAVNPDGPCAGCRYFDEVLNRSH